MRRFDHFGGRAVKLRAADRTDAARFLLGDEIVQSPCRDSTYQTDKFLIQHAIFSVIAQQWVNDTMLRLGRTARVRKDGIVRDGNVIAAFGAEHVSKLTGLSKWQLADWDRAGFFQPEHASPNRREPFSRVYSFQDVVGLKTLAILRKREKVPMWHLHEVAAELEKLVSRPWSEVTLYVLKRRVQFKEPATGQIRGVKDGQYVLLPLESVAQELRQAADRLRERPSATVGKIERHRNVAHNEWVVSGTRIPVRAIREFASAGYSVDQIIKEYPTLKAADVRAALKHAA